MNLVLWQVNTTTGQGLPGYMEFAASKVRHLTFLIYTDISSTDILYP